MATNIGHILLLLAVLNIVYPVLMLSVKFKDVLTNIEQNHSRPETPLEYFTAMFDNVTDCDCGWRNSPQFLGIVGGEETGINEFPSMAALVEKSTGNLYCGASIINDRYLLTAAHCVDQKQAIHLAVLVGVHNISAGSDTPYSVMYQVEDFAINPDYNNSTYDNDIAIIKIVGLITFNSYVGPICVPISRASNYTDEEVIILGWGPTEFSGPNSDVLRKATLSVISNTACSQMQTENITDNEICAYAYGKGTCQSDSGGPVLWTDTSIDRMFLVGIISNDVDCSLDTPVVNARVRNFLSWVLRLTQDSSYCVK